MSTPIDSSSMLKPGTILHGSYRIDSFLSAGGFGNTYVATHLQLDRRMVVKEFFIRGINYRDSDTVTVGVSLSDNKDLFEAQKAKFIKEAQRISMLRNDHIIRVHDLFEENGTTYYLMDYIEGNSLSDLLSVQRHPFNEELVWNVLDQMLSALETVHKAGIWHMDIKPGNILMDGQGQCVLIDFGSSKQMVTNEATHKSTAMTYTPGYAPMEQVYGSHEKWGPWTDFYALGATLYHLLTNQLPPLPSDVLTDSEQAFTALNGVSPAMRQLIIKLMAPGPRQRPQNVQEVRMLLISLPPVYSVPPIQTEPPLQPPLSVVPPQNPKDMDGTRVSVDSDGDSVTMMDEGRPVAYGQPSPPIPQYANEPNLSRKPHKALGLFFKIMFWIWSILSIYCLISLLFPIKYHYGFDDYYDDYWGYKDSLKIFRGDPIGYYILFISLFILFVSFAVVSFIFKLKYRKRKNNLIDISNSIEKYS